MLQCVAVCCSVLQCVAVCCSVLQCVYNISCLVINVCGLSSAFTLRVTGRETDVAADGEKELKAMSILSRVSAQKQNEDLEGGRRRQRGYCSTTSMKSNQKYNYIKRLNDINCDIVLFLSCFSLVCVHSGRGFFWRATECSPQTP